MDKVKREGKTNDDKEEYEEALMEKCGLIFKVRWYRIILDEAQ